MQIIPLRAAVLVITLLWSGGMVMTARGQATLYVNGGCGDDLWSGLSPMCVATSGPKRTIQAAISQSANGDTIIVAPGTYTEVISFLGRAVTIRGSGGAAATTITGGGGPGPVVRFSNGEGRSSVLDGLTVTGGVLSFGSTERAAGVVIQSASPTIQNCVISGNVCGFPSFGPAGAAGMAVLGGSPLIKGCMITGNSLALSLSVSTAGILVTSGSPEFRSSSISNNTGSGVAFAGMRLENSTTVVADCTLSGNQAESGAISIVGGSVQIARCVIASNGGGDGPGGINVMGGSTTIDNCLISGNSSATYGAVHSSGSTTLSNCTVVNNGAGISLRSVAGTVTLSNCIVWGNSGTPQLETSVIATYCDVQGGHPGTGNINVNPAFVSASDFHLAAGSPCIDSGNNAGLPPGVFADLEGRARFFDSPEPNTGNGSSPFVDRGCYEAGAPPLCYPNCDFTIAPNLLNVNDFICFMNHFAAGHPYANCDGITSQLNINDYTCFINAYAAGCP